MVVLVSRGRLLRYKTGASRPFQNLLYCGDLSPRSQKTCFPFHLDAVRGPIAANGEDQC